MRVKAQSMPVACVILAAGKGTRMKSKLPKVMHKIAHRPLLMHVIETARAFGAEQIITVTAPDMEPVRDAVSRTYKNTVENVLQQEQLGTGDAVKAARPLLKDFGGVVLMLYGDTPLIRAVTLEKMVAVFKDSPETAVAVLGMQIAPPNEYGRLVTNGEGDLERIVEAKDANAKEKGIVLCNSGVMAVRGALLFPLLAKLGSKNAKGEYYLTDIVALARADGHRCRVVVADAQELQGINSRFELTRAEASLQWRLRMQAMAEGATLIEPGSVHLAIDTKLGRDVVIHPQVVFGPGVEVADNVEIRSFSHIEGAKIHAGAIIGPFARLRPGAVIGKGAHIGNFVEIKQATIEPGAKANHLSYIGDAHVGENANIGAGTITCNYDGYDKHRTTIGAGAFIGSNTSLVAPVNVGDGAVVGAGSVITEDVEADALAVARAPQKQKTHWAKALRNRRKN
jgi:bifunctional UDP-N-acetylglucosamine pyrophosphorylase/glucosamine-1-phosphate N-acetyltransferase